MTLLQFLWVRSYHEPAGCKNAKPEILLDFQ